MDENEKRLLIENIKAAIGDRLKAAGVNDDNFLTGLKGRLDQLEQVIAEKGSRPALHGLGIADPFAADSFKQRLNLVKEGQPTTGAIHLPNVGIKHLKALVSLPSGGSVGFPTQAQRGPTLEPVIAPLTLVDVLPSTPVSSNQFEYVQLNRTNNAGVQTTEGATKPETSFDADLLVANIATIAHWTQASRQVLSDNVQLSNMLARILAVDVTAKYEALLVNGNGTTNVIHGLLPQATAFAHTKSHAPDRISEALAAMWTAGFIGSAVLMNPLDWSDFETERADAGDGQYVAGGWTNPAAPTVWRTPVARVPSLAAGTALVVDTRFVTMLDRQQVTTAVSSEDRDNFVKNLVTLLSEMRGGLAVYNTDAVVKVDLTGT